MSKILLIASFTSTTTAIYLANAFKSKDINLLTLSDINSDMTDIFVGNAVDVNIICEKYELKPDLILFIEGGTMQLLPIGLDKLNCISAWYGIDTHMDYHKHLMISRLFDVTFVAQKEYVEKLRADGIKQVHWLPLACAPELLPMSELKRDIDISYVGSNNASMNPHRHKLLSLLKNIFPSNKFGLASPKEMGEIYSRSKIVFNKSVNNDINMRFFEAMSCGAVLVTDPIINNGLDVLFEENKHYVVYNNDHELITKVRMLLNDNKVLDGISQNSKQLVLGKHTYQHRTEEILEICTQSTKVANPKPVDYFSALLTLKLYGPALYQCAVAFKQSTPRGFRHYFSLSIGLVLILISKIVGLVEILINKTLK